MADTRPSLNVLSGPLAGQRFVLEDAVDNILIGSDPSCAVCLDSPGVSPIHARLWIDLEGAKVFDTNSPAGVYVNDDRVVKEAPVRNGDILWLGPPGEEGSTLIQCILPPAAAPAAAPVEAAEPAEAAEATGSESDDISATVVGMPAYAMDDMLEPPVAVEPPSVASEPPPVPAAAHPVEDVDATVVMSSAPVMDPSALDMDSPTVAYRPSEPVNLVDDGALEMVDETVSMEPPPLPSAPPPLPTAAPAPSYAAPPPIPMAAPAPAAASAAPVDDMGFPEFEVEPTVVMAPVPPPIPAAPAAASHDPVRFDVPLPVSAPQPEFEDELAETVLDVPAPPIPPPLPKSAPATAEDDSASTVMFHASEMPKPAPPAPAPPPPPPPAPPRAATPAAAPPPPRAAAAAPPPAPPAPPAAAGARPAARPAAEAKPAGARPAAGAPTPAARPAAPAPRPPRAVTPVPGPVAAPAAPRGGGGGKGPIIAAAAGVVLLVIAAGGYFALRGRGTPTAENPPVTAAPVITTPPTTIAAAPPTTEAVAPPVTEAVAPPVTEAAAPVVPTTLAPAAGRTPPPSPRVAAIPPTLPGQRPGTTPTGKPTAAPATTAAAPNPAQQTAATVANLMSQAQAAVSAKNYDAAVTLYDEVLKLQPGNGQATSGRASALSAKSAASAARRAFVSGQTVVTSEKASKGAAVSGFDSADVSVKSTDFAGRLEFAMNPASVKPGDSYRLQIALVNEGKKAIKVSGMTFTITANGQRTGNPVAPRVKEVAPGQRAVLEELPGVFPEANSWTAEVLVTANKGDSMKNQLTWK